MLNNQHDAEDALQISFAKAFNHIEDFNYSSTFGAWLKRIVINNSINILKKKKVRLTDAPESVAEEPVTVTPNEPKYPYSLEQVKTGIAALPDGYRIVLTLYLIEGYDHTEIANIIGVSVSTSKTQYSRARKKLQEILKSY